MKMLWKTRKPQYVITLKIRLNYVKKNIHLKQFRCQIDKSKIAPILIIY